ncbi:MAG: hypothetical protein ABH877_04305 [bacterium]
MRGLFGKYVVKKSSGEPTSPEAEYFVLRLDTDRVARHAARFYARDIESKNPALATEIRQACDRLSLAAMEETLDNGESEHPCFMEGEPGGTCQSDGWFRCVECYRLSAEVKKYREED